jgi:hypothetical protein
LELGLGRRRLGRRQLYAMERFSLGERLRWAWLVVIAALREGPVD